MVKVLLIDNHTLTRIGVATVLSKLAGFTIVGEYSHAHFQQAKQSITAVSAQLVIIDIAYEGESFYDNARQLKEQFSKAKVAIHSHSTDESHVLNAIRDDIDGYIYKNAEPEQLVEAISRILKGEKYFSPEISQVVVTNAYRKSNGAIPFLTTKEKLIIRLLMDGFSSKQIAAQLDVSPRTVHSHRANILSKFNLNNTTQLITRIAEQKITLS